MNFISENTISFTTTENINEIIEDIKNIKKEELIEKIPDLINSIEVGKNYEIEADEFSISIKPTNSSYLENATHVNFTECEKIIREKFNMSNSRIITFLQIEIKNKNEKSLVNTVTYQAYNDNKTLLDLSICNNTNIEIFYKVKNNAEEIDSASYYNDLGIDIFNLNDAFFNDICLPYSYSNNDVVLKDRIKEIYKNYSLCEDGCTYNGLDYDNKMISCDCKVQDEININESSYQLTQFDKIKIDSNFALIKCYNLVFSSKGKSKNIGFWIFLFLKLANIQLLIFFL
jgi:hypothetical protein